MGVPPTCGGVLLLLLQDGWSRTSAKNIESVSKPSQRLRRFFPAAIPNRVIPGTISHSAYSGLLPVTEATVLIGCGVVVMNRVLDCGPFNVSVLELKLQAAALGGELQVSETFPNAGWGDN